MRYSSKFLLSRCFPHAVELLTNPFRVRRRARTRQNRSGRQDPHDETRFVFGSTDRTRTDSYHTPPTRNNSTTKQALGEAARVRGHELAQRLDVNFTLGQRVKLRRSEPINAALEFRA